MKVWMNGQVVEPGSAHVSVFDHGLLYGDGIFEGIRIYDHKIFRLSDHLHRFGTAAKAIGLDLPGGLEQVEKGILETARAFGEAEGYLRLIATRGEGELGVDPTTCTSPNLICIADRIRLFPPEKLARGLDMVTASVRRPAADALDPRVKSLNYLNSVLAKREARMQGADEALILNHAGLVAEASVANVFSVRRGLLSSPPASDGSLEGITRDSILAIAAELGIPARECSLGRFDLLGADEVFLCGSGARIVPVATLDGQPIGDGKRDGTARRGLWSLYVATRDALQGIVIRGTARYRPTRVVVIPRVGSKTDASARASYAPRLLGLRFGIQHRFQRAVTARSASRPARRHDVANRERSGALVKILPTHISR